MKTTTGDENGEILHQVLELKISQPKGRKALLKVIMHSDEVSVHRLRQRVIRHAGIQKSESNEKDAISDNAKTSGNIIAGTVMSLQYCISQIIKTSFKVLEDLGVHHVRILFAVETPWEVSFDYKSIGMAAVLVSEKIELENSLNWLSTLGGAFSALGEKDQQWAEKAGKVSKSQFFIGMKLGSPVIMSRCRLYAAISLIQLGELREARKVVLREYRYAKSLPPELDPRLTKMCIGIWTKLQFEWKNNKKGI